MERKFHLLKGTLQVLLENGEAPREIVGVLSDAARLARERNLQNLLVLSGVDDPMTAEAASTAVDEIHACGVPPPLRIAFVACMLPQYDAYRFAARHAETLGILAKVTGSAYDAKRWLGLHEHERACALEQ